MYKRNLVKSKSYIRDVVSSKWKSKIWIQKWM